MAALPLPRFSVAPYGWRWVPDGAGGQLLYPEAGEQRVLRYARQLRAFGYTLREIEAQLERDGHAPAEGQRWRATELLALIERDDAALWERFHRWSEAL
jgi:hypothetical protein